MFKDIEVEDLVLVPVGVKKGAFDRNPKIFWCRCGVSKVTPKRFTVNGQTYSKVNGDNIKAPEPYRSKRPPCKVYTPDQDEYEDFLEYKKLLNTQATFRKLLGSVDVEELSMDQIRQITSILKGEIK